MAVILSTGQYSVRRRAHDYPRDAHGTPVPGDPGPPAGPWPGAAVQQQDGSWSIRLDPKAWPLREDDLVEDATGQRWIVVGRPTLYRNSVSGVVDYVGVRAALEPPLRE